MSQPIAYHGNLLLSGVAGVKGVTSESSFFPIDPENPGRRLWDGSVLLPYAISGTLVSVIVVHHTAQVVTTEDHFPDTLIYYGTGGGVAENWSLAVLQSASFEGGAATTNVSDSTPGEDPDLPGLKISPFTIDAVAGKRYWIVNTQGVSFWTYPVPRAYWIAKAWTMPRSPSVGVERTRVRQFSRVPVPNGQPFVKRFGPTLRQTTYSSVMVSGAEIDAFNAFLADVEGGEIFPFTDDLGDSYLAELTGPAIVEPDEAGVYAVALTFREVDPGVFE